MTYGLISDIHANLEALEAVLDELGGVDGFLCMGDLVGYGADPGPCLERVRRLPRLICVAGNHDLAAIGSYDLNWFNPFARAALQWTAEHLSAEEKSYLGSLSLTAHADGAVVVHGSLPDEMDYITAPDEARVCFDAMPGDLAFIGHTHVTEYYRTRRGSRFPEQVALWSGGGVELKEGVRYIVNPGAIGQPRDGNPAASFGIWRVEDRVVEIRRVGYDIETAQEKMKRERLPDYLVERLAIGR
jgi:diadenosine tetraphosphatase ApaH/serine/threonine PP2A family protein phosphatase